MRSRGVLNFLGKTWYLPIGGVVTIEALLQVEDKQALLQGFFRFHRSSPSEKTQKGLPVEP